MNKKRSLILFLFAVLFLISGTAGLIYQIVWERLLSLYFGVTIISITLIVSAFMAGLGFGSLLGGRIARRFENTLLLYGLLEIGIALFGVVSPRIIVWIGESTAGSPYVLVFLISFAILLIPTTLMGMTLPLLTQSFVAGADTSGQVIGLLYGINTLGAALGALLSGYVLVGFFGFEGAVYIAVFLNGLVGVIALVLARWQAVLASEAAVIPMTSGGDVFWGYGTILVASFLVGFIGLGFEIVWIRLLMLVNKSTAYSFPSILAVFLFGLAMGGYVWGRMADRSRNPVALFCKLELAGAAAAAFTFLFFGWSLDYSPPWTEDFFETQKPILPFVESGRELFFSRRALLVSLWDYFLPILIMVLPATLLLGGGLPVLDRIAIQNPLLSGRRVGDIHLANITGSVAGALVISFVFLPGIGSEWTLKVLVLSTFVFPILYLFNKAGRASPAILDYGLASLGVITLVGVLLLPGRGEFYQKLYVSGTEQEAVVSESGDSVLALTYEPDTARQAGLFWIGGEINSFFPAKGLYEGRALACAGAVQPKRILIIGFGGGFSALFYKSIPEVEEIVIVELLGEIGPFLQDNLESAYVTLGDPRLTYVVDDGRRYLNAFPDEKFDLISIDPLRDHTAGHNNLYSLEAMEIYRSHLTSGGVLCVWMDEHHIIPNTVAQAFPYVDQYVEEFMVASNNSIVYNTAYMDRAVHNYASLTEELYGPEGRVVLGTQFSLSRFVRDQSQIRREEGHKQTLRDMQPLLEYYLFQRPVKEEFRIDDAVIGNFQKRIE